MDMNQVQSNALFPPEDYNKKGELKKVRFRVLKKLLKYDFTALLPLTLVAVVTLVFHSVLLSIALSVEFGKIESEIMEDIWMLFTNIIGLLLYFNTIFIVCALPIFLSIFRYYKNFFGKEGYLTFSIPASPEEQLLSKRISAIGVSALGGLSAFISLWFVFFTITGEDIKFIFYNGEGALIVAEIVLLFFLAIIAFLSASGAFICWTRKFEKKGALILRLIVAYFVASFLCTLLFSAIMSPTNFRFLDELNGHVIVTFLDFVLLGIIALCTWYELRTLKKRMNLK